MILLGVASVLIGLVIACEPAAIPAAPVQAPSTPPTTDEAPTSIPPVSGEEEEIRGTVAAYWGCYDPCRGGDVDVSEIQSLVSHECWEERGNSLALALFMAKQTNCHLAIGKATVDGETATVSIMVEQYNNSFPTRLKLLKEDGAWKIAGEVLIPKTEIGDTFLVDYGNRRWSFTIKDIFLIRYVQCPNPRPVVYKDKPIPHGIPEENIEGKSYRIGVELAMEGIGRLPRKSGWRLQMCQVDEYGEVYPTYCNLYNPDKFQDGLYSSIEQCPFPKYGEVRTCLYVFAFYDWIESFAMELTLSGVPGSMVGPFKWQSLPGYVEGWL